MATAPATTGARTRAPSNVVRLPTAAARKVQNPMNRAKRAAKAALPQFTGEYFYPSERTALELAEAVMEIPPSPAMELLTAMVRILDEGDRMKVAAALVAGKMMGRRSAAQALAVVMTSRPNMTIGERLDFSNAIKRLQEGRA